MRPTWLPTAALQPTSAVCDLVVLLNKEFKMALLYVFHQAGGDGADGQLRYAVFDGTSWSADIPLNIAMSESPAAVPWAGGITVFHQGSNYDGQLLYTFSRMAKTGAEIH